jgi:hypothetical protein
MDAYYSDLHCHTPLFSYNRLYPDTWYEWYFPVFPAQGDFCQLARGNVRVVMVSLYPIEQGFVKLSLFNAGTKGLTDFLAKLIVDIPKQRSDEIQDKNHDYFDDLLKELEFMQASALPVTHKVFTGPFTRKEFKYRIVSDWFDLKELLEIDDSLNPGAGCKDTIAVVLTIEGAHSLGVGQKNTLELAEDKLIEKLSKNIGMLKRLGPPGKEGAWCPFFISLDHHFWNQLGGHAVSLWNIVRKALDQREGINQGITEAGKFVISELLSTREGDRRILIDVAHMSVIMRKWYYSYLEERGDHIPVIISHTGINGFATMDEAEMHGSPDQIHDIADDRYERSTKFNTWDIFVSDEEIMIVHRSGGIMGLNLDRRIGMGKATLDETRKKARFKSGDSGRMVWVSPLVNQILHIAGHILGETGNPEVIWDNISIGSDFNGMITPLNAFRSAEQMPGLQESLIRELKNRRTSEKTLLDKTDSDIEEIVDKILWKNNIKFLKINFR